MNGMVRRSKNAIADRTGSKWPQIKSIQRRQHGPIVIKVFRIQWAYLQSCRSSGSSSNCRGLSLPEERQNQSMSKKSSRRLRMHCEQRCVCVPLLNQAFRIQWAINQRITSSTSHSNGNGSSPWSNISFRRQNEFSEREPLAKRVFARRSPVCRPYVVRRTSVL